MFSAKVVQNALMFALIFALFVPGAVLNLPPKYGDLRGDLVVGVVDMNSLVRSLVHGVLMFMFLGQVA